jgi:hypothetical protein
MPRSQVQQFVVWVYRPNGWLLTKITESATKPSVAVARAKKAIQKQGRLAHFYTFVPKTH